MKMIAINIHNSNLKKWCFEMPSAPYSNRCPIKLIKMKLRVLTALFIIVGFIARSENPCNIMTPQKSGEWGVGLFYFPEESSIPFYFSHNGDTAGFITRNKYGKLDLDFIIDTTKFKINYNDFNWLGHTNATLLKVYKIQEHEL